jgi:hypothetical protein
MNKVWILAFVLCSCQPAVVVIPPAPAPVEKPAPVVEAPATVATPAPVVEPIATPAPVVETPPQVVEVVPAPVAPPPAPLPNVRVYNSAWEIVQEGYVAARAVTTIQSYADYVAAYNEKTKDDQFFLIEGEAIIPIENSPVVDAYIADPVTHDIIKEYLDWPRADLAERREAWRMQAYADGGILYVDRVPPPPVVVVDERPAYEKYALYLVYTETGLIKYEEHLETEAEYLARKSVYDLQAYADGGLTYVVSGRLYP